MKVKEENDEQLAEKDKLFEELYKNHEALKKEYTEKLDKKDRYHVKVRARSS